MIQASVTEGKYCFIPQPSLKLQAISSSETLVKISFIYSSVCHTTGLQTLRKRVLHTVRSSASSFSAQYTLVSFRSFSSCLLLLPPLPVTPILPCTFPSTQYTLVSFMSSSSCLLILPPLPVTPILPYTFPSTQYTLVSFMSSRSCLLLLHCLPVTPILPCTFP